MCSDVRKTEIREYFGKRYSRGVSEKKFDYYSNVIIRDADDTIAPRRYNSAADDVRRKRACGQRVMRGLQLCTVRRRPWSYYGRTRHDNCATQTFSGRRRRGYRGSGCATLWAECSGPKGRPISAPRARRCRHCGA